MLSLAKYAAFTALLATAACSSGGSSSGGGVGPSSPGNLTAAQVRALPVTAKMPTRGTATYNGSTSQSARSNGINITTTSDVRLDANFASNTIDGRISNIKGTSGGNSARARGDLTGTGVIRGPSFYVPVDGILTVDGAGSTYSAGSIEGDFKGKNANAIQGTVTMGSIPTTALIATQK
ncbi:transferrin-binding protein-like solute binding protein [Cypionkella sp.]|uniref:transferrin-binding protein-like solute binding protein n=1 Tax=Cypionkella sp. TaxID=2811411 RepID=UPI0026049A28|nr:transferrin-binding protein-like solute binding protein [Cypionkella sp.]MDB5665573.1 hypothetical protein [Cypionkella sp.]